MRKVTKILTDDNRMFDTVKDAVKHLDREYGNRLTGVVHKILHITSEVGKYIALCEFLDENLMLFDELSALKSELRRNITDEDDD